MSYETMIFENRDGVGLLTMNRPERMNAVNGLMFREFRTALDEVSADESVQVLVLTGAGRAFCAAADMKEHRETRIGIDHPPTLEEMRQFIRAYPQTITRKLRDMEKPTIAMVNGPAVADGVDWALVCDIRVGSENTRFMNAFVRMAAFPNTGGTWLYPRFMGMGRAMEFLYTGEWMEAEEAHKLGILNKLVPADSLEEETMALARKIADGPPIAIKLIKMQTYQGLGMSFEAALEMAADGEAMTLVTEDHLEAVTAFLEKRKPVFRGR